MREVVPRLIEAGHDVRGVDNYSRYGREDPPAGIEFIEGDLTDREVVRTSLRGVDGVIQAAAQIYGVAGFHRYPADILQQDTLLHGLVLRESLDLGVKRVVYISSSMVYERLADVAREDEVADMLVPLTGYGLSKLMGERLSQAFSEQYGLEYTIWRPFNIIGVHENAAGYDPGVCHVFADFIQRIVHEKQNPMLVLGSGTQVRCFTWIEDIAACIAQRSFDTATKNDHFNLGNAEPVTMIDLAQRIYRIYYDMIGEEVPGELTFTHAPTFTDDVQVRIPGVDKAAEILGWRAQVKLDEMLHRILAHDLEESRHEVATGRA
jgi:nucleoside-diphosphate-sugar epimerase